MDYYKKELIRIIEEGERTTELIKVTITKKGEEGVYFDARILLGSYWRTIRAFPVFKKSELIKVEIIFDVNRGSTKSVLPNDFPSGLYGNIHFIIGALKEEVEKWARIKDQLFFEIE